MMTTGTIVMSLVGLLLLVVLPGWISEAKDAWHDHDNIKAKK